MCLVEILLSFVGASIFQGWALTEAGIIDLEHVEKYWGSDEDE